MATNNNTKSRDHNLHLGYALIWLDLLFIPTMPPKSRKARQSLKQGAESSDEEEDVAWLQHPARELLKDAFMNDRIPLDWNRRPKDIYDKFVDDPAFAGVSFDATFTSRLRSLRDIVKRKKQRVTTDQAAFDIFRKNHPERQVNDIGDLRWEGSSAQAFLKQDMKDGLHLGLLPSQFRETRGEYKLFSKTKFRKHIHQEKRLGKLHNYLQDLDQKKQAKSKKRRGDGRKKPPVRGKNTMGSGSMNFGRVHQSSSSSSSSASSSSSSSSSSSN